MGYMYVHMLTKMCLFASKLSVMSYQNVTSPETRGSAFSLFNLTDDLGKGGGPVVIAALVLVLDSRRYSMFVCM